MAKILDMHGSPYPTGRSFNRAGASHRGTNAKWKPSLISRMQAEREKKLTSTRSWDLYTNTAMGRGIISGAKIDTIGTGLTPLPTLSPQQLGITGDAARELTQAQIDAFMLWGFDPRHFCDGQARQNFYQLQGWGYLSWKLDGIGIFQVSFEEEDDIRPSRLILTPIDSGRLKTPVRAAGRSAAINGKAIYDGIEVDSRGKPIALHLTKGNNPGLASANLATERFSIWSEKTGLPEFLLITGVDNIAEYRQGSMLEPIMKLIRDTEELQDAALVGALTAQLFSIVMGKSAVTGGGDGGDPEQQNSNKGTYDWEDAVYQLMSGTIIEAPLGMEPKSIETGKPGPNFDAHMDQLKEHAGTATQRGKENMTRTYQSSFSASIANILAADRVSDDDRVVMDSCFNQPAWSWHCYGLAVTGQAPLPVGIDPVRDLYLYSAATFLPPPPKVLQPLPAAKANQIKLETGETTLSEVWSKNNKDPEKSFQQLAADKAKMLELQNTFGVDLGVRPYPPEKENNGDDTDV